VWGRWATVALTVISCAATGCSDEATAPTPVSTPPPQDDCADDELLVPDGSCIRPGIAPDDCGAGFAHDGLWGCTPILPDSPCPPGMMAVPGETRCRLVAPCGEGTWGDIPLAGEPNAQHVDAAYAGNDSDGSSTKPWTTITDAIDAADPGALIAVAAGNYIAHVRIEDKPVRLWGRCPELVEVIGAGATPPAIVVANGADTSEIHAISVTGPGIAIAVSGAEDVLLDQLWIHDAGHRGMSVEDTLGVASATLSRSLVEGCHQFGVATVGADSTIQQTVVRDTQPFAAVAPAIQLGIGVSVTADLATGQRANATVIDSLVARNRAGNVSVGISDATIERTAIRDGLPGITEADEGRGITLRESATALISKSVIERSQQGGVVLDASAMTIEHTVVTDTLPQSADQSQGRGIQMQNASVATMTNTLVQRSHQVGISIASSQAAITGSVVTATHPDVSSALFGRGINVQTISVDDAPSVLTLSTSLIEYNTESGIVLIGSTADLHQTSITNTAPVAADLFGDGIAVSVALPSPPATLPIISTLALTATLIETNARAGISNFGSLVTLGTTKITCHAFDLNAEPAIAPATFDDLGDNLCGCPTATDPCKVVSSTLTPPTPIDN
jgi:hypothetical protein